MAWRTTAMTALLKFMRLVPSASTLDDDRERIRAHCMDGDFNGAADFVRHHSILPLAEAYRMIAEYAFAAGDCMASYYLELADRN
jgi:hypothetical protein